jgi:GH15 family glucan-1,4-alpha-glucosidase
MAASIEDYGLIGDCETAALVSKDGSIDWLCWPRFDSGACFAALLGDTSNGRWCIAPAASDVRVTRRYRPSTLILETSFVTVDGEVMLVDFLALQARDPHLVRLVVGKHGTVPMSTELIIRFDYGSSVPWVRKTDGGIFSRFPDRTRLSCARPLSLVASG